MRVWAVLPLFVAALSASDTIRVSLSIPAETNAGRWHVRDGFAEIPQSGLAPKLISAPQSFPAKTPTYAFITVSFDIDPKGLPLNVQVDKSSDKELDDEVIAMIREWRFEAALTGGLPVASHASLDLSLGDAQLPPPDRRPRKKN